VRHGDKLALCADDQPRIAGGQIEVGDFFDGSGFLHVVFRRCGGRSFDGFIFVGVDRFDDLVEELGQFGIGTRFGPGGQQPIHSLVEIVAGVVEFSRAIRLLAGFVARRDSRHQISHIRGRGRELRMRGRRIRRPRKSLGEYGWRGSLRYRRPNHDVLGDAVVAAGDRRGDGCQRGGRES
jgi:hypothetical protein